MASFRGAADRSRSWWTGVRELPKVEAILLVNTLVGCVGFGLYTSVSVIYFSTFADVSAVQVGLGFSLTASVWVVAAGTVGRLVDRIGPKETTVGAGAVQGLLLACLPLVHGVAAFLILMCVLGIAERGASVSREALLAQLVDEKRRVATAARSRSVANIGVSLGTALAGVALAVHTRTAFVVLLVTYALLTLAVSAISLQYPRVPGRRAAAGSGPSGVLRDPPFLAVALLSGLVSIYDTVLVIGLPLWIAHHTEAPTAIFAALIIANTLLIILFQVRAARGVESVPDARRALVQGSLAAAFACAVFAATAWTDTAVLAGAVLAAGVLLLTAGELRAAAADWALRFGLAHPEAQGEYGAIHSLGSTIRSICGPVLVTFLLSTWTDVGWLVLIGVFLALAAATGPVVGWAQRTRSRYVPAPGHPEAAPATTPTVPSRTDGVADEPGPAARPQGATR
ncbi:MFS transporter [Micromonospora sp. DT233]|uniref:MFS transporter n=1 Tax=Micromonospora sp. DT233 TaxID=3393432 RepID=UPI003CEEE0E7